MNLELFCDTDVATWQKAVDQTLPSPSPLAGPEFVATTIRGWEKTYILRSGDLIIPLARSQTRHFGAVQSDYYIGAPMHSFLGMTDPAKQLSSVLEDLSGDHDVEIELPESIYTNFATELAKHAFELDSQHVYHSITLPAEYEEWYSRRHVKRYSIRHAIKSGVSIEFGGEELVPSAYEMYTHSFERWRDMKTASSSHDFARFNRLFEMPGSRARIAVAKLGDKVVASVIFCYYAKTAAYLYGGIDYEYKKSRANSLLQAEIIRQLISLGIREYNLGTSLGLKDLEHFKESLGAERFSYVRLCRHRFPRLKKIISTLSSK